MDETDEDDVNRENLFVKDDLPVGFFFHRSIKNIGQREKLQADIEAYGGRVVSTDEDADTVLVDSKYNAIDALRDVYNISDDPVKRNVFVEKMSFVQHCIKYGQFKHRPPIIKRMGGQVGRSRVPFTPEDDEHLARYIARKLPDVDAGGRKGDAIYLWLYEVAELSPKEYAWVYRHTADSWRERYRKNVERFNERIAEIVEQEMTSRKQRWKEDRRMPRRGRRGRRMEMDEDEEEEEEEEEDFDEEGGVEIEESQEPEQEQDGEMQHQEVLFMPEIASDDERAVWNQPGAGEKANISGQATKRRKSQLDTSVHPVAKRRRSEVSGEDSHIQPAGDKGKGKATTNEEEEDHTSLFSVDDEPMPFEAFEANDPGPSHTLSSPDRTLAENPARRQQSPEAFMTQATLVELNSPSRTTNFEPVSHSTSANKHHSANTTRSLLLSLGEEHLSPPAVQQPPSQRFTAARKTAQIARPQPSPTHEAPRSPAVAIPPTRRGPKPRPKRRPPLAVVQGNNEPPYRNTRSRSRSVEPVALPPPKHKRKTKRSEAIPEEVEVEEVVPATETQEEEMVVEDLLTTNSAHQTTRLRALSLETDDAQTRQDLASSSTFRRTNPSDILRTFEERYPVPATQQASMQPPALSHKNQRPRQIGPQPHRPQMATNTSAGALKIPVPRTPNTSRVRAQSTSSTEPFPIPGTKASAAKQKIQEQEKRTPYKPPQGTRAAQLFMSRLTDV